MSRQVNTALPELPLSEQIRNKTKWNDSRSKTSADFYTVGYSRRTASDFVVALVESEVQTLIDIRFTPLSQFKPEFSKSNLARLMAGAGIEYLHRPDLGVPRDIRAKAIGYRTRRRIWNWYDQHVASPFGSNLDQFFNWANHPVALMCTEYDPTACHRHRLSQVLENGGLASFDI